MWNLGKKIMTRMAHLLGHPMDARLHSPSDEWVLPKQLVGLEFEAENVGIRLDADHELRLYYDAKADHSLRDGGVEFVFKTPLMGEDLSKALDLMEKYSKNFTLNDRCGLHVHLDVREPDQVNVYRLFQLYALYEYFIYRFIGDNRDSNNYCVPWYKSAEQYGKLASVLTTNKVGGLSGKLSESAISRYMGLNIQSLERFGSLEFRHMKNTNDFGRIRTWINMIFELKKAAELDSKVGDDFLNTISLDGALEFTKKHLPLMYWLFGDSPEFPILFEKGMDTCREMSFSAFPKRLFNRGLGGLFDKYSGASPGVEKFIQNQLKTEPL